MTVSIRQLTGADAAAFRSIRLEGLLQAPEAFGSTYESENSRSIEEFAATLTRGHIVGAHTGDALVGVAGFYVLAGSKSAHRGYIWGVYVQAAARSRGVGRALVETLLSHAEGRVLQVHLTVVTENRAAVALYERLGFASYGTEPRSLKVADRFYDERLMVRFLDGAAP